MTHGWRNLAVVLGLVCSWQAWRGCQRPSPRVTAADDAPVAPTLHTARAEATRPHVDEPRAPAAPTSAGPRMFGVKLPPWATALLPGPGEDLRGYRDRMLPLAQLAVAPQRARVARSRDHLVQLLRLDAHQQAELETQTQDTAQAIQDRLFNAALSGDFAASSFKPMAAVTVARDVLDLVDHANQRFVASLTAEQRTQLAGLPFDFADYLLFSTRWEDAITGL